MTTTRPVCACGCGYPVSDSMFWSSDACHSRWLGQREQPKPTVVSESEYRRRPWLDAPVTPAVGPGPVARVLGRMFGKDQT